MHRCESTMNKFEHTQVRNPLDSDRPRHQELASNERQQMNAGRGQEAGKPKVMSANAQVPQNRIHSTELDSCSWAEVEQRIRVKNKRQAARSIDVTAQSQCRNTKGSSWIKIPYTYITWLC